MIPATSASMREKAAIYLANGRVVVVQADDDVGLFVARVAGDSGGEPYTAFRSHAAGVWWCDCPAGGYGRTCSHQAAVALVAG